jgi:hypothetical protein
MEVLKHQPGLKKEEDNPPIFETIVLLIVIVTTVFQFSMWGTDMVKFILGSIYGVVMNDVSVFTTIVGALAIIGSAITVAGAGYWFMKRWDRAFSLIKIGGVFFITKNIVDIIDSMVVFGQMVPNPTRNDINDLALVIGSDIAQLGFWVFVIVYFYTQYKKHTLTPVETVA